MPMTAEELKSPHKEVLVPLVDRALAALRRNGREGLSTTQLSQLLGPASTTISDMMRKPLKSGLVTRRKSGGRAFYSITQKGMENTHGKREK